MSKTKRGKPVLLAVKQVAHIAYGTVHTGPKCSDCKKFRAMIRSGETYIGPNDGKYTHYQFSSDANEVKELIQQARERRQPATADETDA